LRVVDPVTDRVGALAVEGARVRQALDRLRDANRTQLFVAYVSSFDGMNGQQWSDETARRSQLGDRDVLLAVAVDDRACGYSDVVRVAPPSVPGAPLLGLPGSSPE
jgi:uncharacterized membrane protein YgcG